MTEDRLTDVAREYRQRQRFEYSARYVKANEGSGVVTRFFGEGRSRFGVQQSDIPNTPLESLTENRATEVLEIQYWNVYPYRDILAPEVAAKIFDTDIFITSRTAHETIQETLQELGYTDVVQTGVLDIETVNVINQVGVDVRTNDFFDMYIRRLRERVQNTGISQLKRQAAVRRVEKRPARND